jgi:D-sedoheptulose 7-phosphate isomerase
MKQKILQSISDGIKAIELLKAPKGLAFIESSAKLIAEAFGQGSKVLIAGNGGSLCDAMHFAEELTGVFRHRRKALPAIALSDSGHLTCVGNDLGYADVFARGVEAYGKEGDVFVALTTSGNSPNLVNATAIAKKMGLKTVAFLGKTGGKLKGVADLEWVVEGFSYSDRIQEAHMAALHIIIEMIEHELFDEKTQPEYKSVAYGIT